MRRRWYLGMLALLGLLVIGGVTVAQAERGGGRTDISDENHFRCYIVSKQTPSSEREEVILNDQFDEFRAAPGESLTVGEPLQFCAPVSKTHVDAPSVVFDIEDENEHLTMYPAFQELDNLDVEFTDQFSDELGQEGRTKAEITAARYLLVPTTKTLDTGETFEARRLNHYWCYEANAGFVNQMVDLEDQFSDPERPDRVRVEELRLFCNPVEKTHDGETTRIQDEDVHLACYEIHGPQRAKPFEFGVEDQFEADRFQITSYELLCAPAEKHEESVTPSG
jgi:hypothetical protein